MKETLVNSEYLYKGRIVTLRKDTVKIHNGTIATREVVEHAPAVVVLPFEPPETVYLVRQYRRAVDQVLLEAPAGIMDKNETPLDAAVRELKEETGFSATQWKKLGEAYPTPGFCDEYMHFYLAQGLTKGQNNFDVDEYVEVVEYTLSQLEKLYRDNQLIDVKTVLMYLMLKDKIKTDA